MKTSKNKPANFPYYFFYVSIGLSFGDHLIDFNNVNHVNLIKYIQDIKDYKELNDSQISRVRYLCKKAGLPGTSVSKYYGPDVSFRGNKNKNGKLNGKYSVDFDWVDINDIMKFI